MPARGKKRPILDILSDFQVAEVDWEVDCLVLMDELLQAPNAWPFRAAAIKPDEGAQHGTLDSIKARLISREYPNALEWATDVRRLLSSYLPQKDEKETGGSFPKLNSASTLDKDLGADVEYTDKWVSFAWLSVPCRLRRCNFHNFPAIFDLMLHCQWRIRRSRRRDSALHRAEAVSIRRPDSRPQQGNVFRARPEREAAQGDDTAASPAPAGRTCPGTGSAAHGQLQGADPGGLAGLHGRYCAAGVLRCSSTRPDRVGRP